MQDPFGGGLQWTLEHHEAAHPSKEFLPYRSKYIASYIHDSGNYFIPILSLERSLSHEQFVCQHADTPQINSTIISLPLDYLWRSVVKSPTKSRTNILNNCWPSEITELRNAHGGNNDIFRFDISMCDRPFMQVDESIDDILEEICSLAGRQYAYFILEIKKRASLDVLHH